jgi:hypothetical protein
MPKRILLLTTGALAAGLAGIVIAGQWRQAPGQPVYPVRATPEMMQLSRDEHDLIAEMIKAQLAAERGQFQKQKVAASATPVASRTTTARPRADRTLSSLRSGRNG